MNTSTQWTTDLFTQGDYLEVWVEAFLRDRKARHLSSGTLHFYRKKLELFAGYCEAQSVTQISQLNAPFIREFFLHLEETGHNAGGIHGFFRSLKAFLRWFWDEAELSHPNPISKVKAPRVPDRQLEPVNYQDILAMMETCKNTLVGRRDQAVLLFLLDSGVRASELLGVLLSETDILGGRVFIRQAKGGVPRNVYLGLISLRALRRYLKLRRDTCASLWITKDAQPLSYWGLREVMVRRSETARVPTPSLHSFRRWWAVNFLRNGGKVFELQRAGGWKSLQAMRPYVKLSEGDIQQAMRQHSPIDNMRSA